MGKEITPRRQAAIVTLRCLDIPMTFNKIEDITWVSTSNASDIWRHALANARSARLAQPVTTEHISKRFIPLPVRRTHRTHRTHRM